MGEADEEAGEAGEEDPAEVAAAIERARRKRVVQFRAVLTEFEPFFAVGR